MIQPPDAPRRAITEILRDWTAGKGGALEELTSATYADLYAIARRELRLENGPWRQRPTELVHEAYLKLAAMEPPQFNGRVHFLRVAGRIARRILVDQARARQAAKRGATLVSLEAVEQEAAAGGECYADMLAVDAVLTRLAEFDGELAELVEMKFFAGLTIEEIAALREVSTTTVKRDWRTAQAWLFRELNGRGI
jgi:RNA polymerase sigma factor (TIGR02999 family)